MQGQWTLRDLVGHARGYGAWYELEEQLAEVRDGQPRNRTAVSAALRVLGTLAAVNKTGGRGYRGIIAPLEELAELVGRTSPGSCSPATVRNALRMLEGAGLVERGRAGRGRAVEYQPETFARSGVLCVTLTQDAIELWSGRKNATLRPDPDDPLNFSGRYLDEKGSGAPRDARSSVRAPGRPRSATQAVSPDSAGDGSTRPRGSPSPSRARDGPAMCRGSTAGSPATSGHRASVGPAGPRTAPGSALRASAGAKAAWNERLRPPERRFSGRPRPAEPPTYERARRALLYDLETELRRRGPPNSDRILDQVVRETAVSYRGPTSVPWDAWIWLWRESSYADRRRNLGSAILPAVMMTVRRLELCDLPADPDVRITTPARREPYPVARWCSVERPPAVTGERAGEAVERLAEIWGEEYSARLQAWIRGDHD